MDRRERETTSSVMDEDELPVEEGDLDDNEAAAAADEAACCACCAT